MYRSARDLSSATPQFLLVFFMGFSFSFYISYFEMKSIEERCDELITVVPLATERKMEKSGKDARDICTESIK